MQNSPFLKNSLTKITPKNLFTPSVLIFFTLILIYSIIATRNISWGGDNRFFYLIITILLSAGNSFLIAYQSILKSMEKNRWILGIVSIVIFGASVAMSLQAFEPMRDGTYPRIIFYFLGGIVLNYQIQSFLIDLKVFNRLNYFAILYFFGCGLILEQGVSDVIVFQNTTINFVEILTIVGAFIASLTFMSKFREFVEIVRVGADK